jgi:hypothetical protein
MTDQTVALKPCGDCTLCCKVMGVAAVNKPGGVWCSHIRRGAGCAIYADRPASCSTFQCLWSGSENLDDRWRPDRARFLMFTENGGKRLNVVADPGYPAAWRQEPYYSRLKAMSQRAYDGFELVVCIGDRRIVIFPDQEADLGAVRPDQKIVSGYAKKDGQDVAFAMVLSDVEAQGQAS